MKLVVLFGPHAVGKMTVGQELAKRTGLKLFHNHMTIDLVANFFDYGSPEGQRLVQLFRREIFEAVAKSDMPGMIFTYMWALDEPGDWEYIREVAATFEKRGGKVYYVELCADFDVRIERNKTPNRLANKPTKRDIARSEAIFRSVESRYRLNSYEGEIRFPRYLRIDNTRMQPEEVARCIHEYFEL